MFAQCANLIFFAVQFIYKVVKTLACLKSIKPSDQTQIYIVDLKSNSALKRNKGHNLFKIFLTW